MIPLQRYGNNSDLERFWPGFFRDCMSEQAVSPSPFLSFWRKGENDEQQARNPKENSN